MKKLSISLAAGLALLCFTARAQESREHITREFSPANVQSGVLAVYNLNGPIKVEGYAGDKVVVEVDKVISADDSDLLALGVHEFKLGFQQKGDSIIVYIAEPFDTQPHKWDKYDGWNQRKIEYDFQLAFTVKIPYAMNLTLSTVNRGDILVEDVAGNLDLNNVNGPI